MKKCRYGKLKKKVGRRVCKLKPKAKARSKSRRSSWLKRNNRIRRDNERFAKLTKGEKAAELKRRLPGMEWAIDQNPHLYGYRRRR